MTGIDNSPAMLEVAESHGRVEVEFELRRHLAVDVRRRSRPRARERALQWVPDHRAVLERWVAALAPEGQLAVQVPANHDHPSHLASSRGRPPGAVPVGARRHTAARPGGGQRARAAAVRRAALRTRHQRATTSGCRCTPTCSSRPADVVEWTRGHLADPLLPTPAGRSARAVRRRLPRRTARSHRAHEPYFYTFKRILMWARLLPDRFARGRVPDEPSTYPAHHPMAEV